MGIFKIAIILVLVKSPTGLLGGYVDYEDYGDYADYVDVDYQNSKHTDYDEHYDDGEMATLSSVEESHTGRFRRYQDKSAIIPLRTQDSREVRGAIKQLLAGMAAENPFTPHTTETASIESPDPAQSTSTATYDMGSIANTNLTSTDETIPPTNYLTEAVTQLLNTYRFTTDDHFKSTQLVPQRSSWHREYIIRNSDQWSTVLNSSEMDFNENEIHRKFLFGSGTTTQTTQNIIPTNTTTTTTTKTTKMRPLDIPRLLEIIADLASEFETNLTKKLHDHLIKMSIPTCSTPTTETPTTSEYDANYTGAIVGKCFVCGLEETRIPERAYCADAFAGDFLPLVPVDPSAKGQISRFRKYCKYSNVHGYRYNRSQPRAIFGRWTGGCSVRWTDVTGIYTQRSCRNRIQPTTGKHFASKRMAKLEKSLWNVENGCIFSPMATLLPLSRGISLYARFHACVCTGSWCNRAHINAQWTPNIILLLFVTSVLNTLVVG